MACSRPATMWLVDGEWCFGLPRGASPGGHEYQSQPIGCGSCLLCRKSRGIDLSTRLQHEAYCHAQSIVVTLTYEDDKLPALGSVSKRHAELFLKQVRNHAWRVDGVRVRHDFISEYSPVKRRAHYHGVLFGWRPSDAEYYKQSRGGNRMYRSAMLDECWPHGVALFEDFSSSGAAYVANHQALKLRGRALDESLAVRDVVGDLVGYLEPEFHLISRHPGLGAAFFEKHAVQMLANQFTVAGRVKVAVPRYYKRLAARVPGHADAIDALTEAARLASQANAANSTPERLAVREEVAKAAERVKRNRGRFDA